MGNLAITIRLNVNAFYNRINATLFGGEMSDNQKEGLDTFLNAWVGMAKRGELVPTYYLAYTLATTYHETAYTMQPIEEYGKGKGKEYGVPDPLTGKTYYGRGYAQVTWARNYKILSGLIVDVNGNLVDCYNNPELLLVPDYAAQAMLFGMRDGIFTGKKLSDYLNKEDPDFYGARRVINGLDAADKIESEAYQFLDGCNLLINYPVDRVVTRKGSKNEVDVIELQLALGLNPDGDFGGKTYDAVIDFQRENGLVDDGVVGNTTWTHLERYLLSK